MLSTARTRVRRAVSALLALAVAGGIAGTFPATAAAEPVQTLTVQTGGVPEDTQVRLYAVEVDEGRVQDWWTSDSEYTDGAGRVSFVTVPGQTYSLRIDETAETNLQFFGGANYIQDAAFFTAPADGSAFEQRMDVPKAPLLTAQTSGLPKGASVQLLRVYVENGSVVDYDNVDDRDVDAAGVVTFKVQAGASYTLRAGSDGATFLQHLGGARSAYDAQFFTTPANGGPTTQTFAVRAAATLQGEVSVLPGVRARYGEVDAYVWDEFYEEWHYVASSTVALGGYALKVEPGKVYTVGAYGTREDGAGFVTKYAGGARNLAAAQRFTAADGQTVEVPRITLDEVYLGHAVTVTGLPKGGTATVALRALSGTDNESYSVSETRPTAEFTRLLPGPYLVSATSDAGVASQIIDVTVTGGTTTLALAPAAGTLSFDRKVSGASRVGAKLTVSTKINRPATGATVTTYWSIGGKVVATGDAFTVPASALDAELTAVTVVSAPGHASSAASWWTTITEKGDAPRASVAPRIAGTPKVGSAVTATLGTWDVADAQLAVQWTRDGAPIAGATGASYTPVAADAGKLLGVTVTASATNRADTSIAVQAAAAVAPGNAVAFTAKITGTPKIGATLGASAAPQGWVAKYQWLRNGKTIKGATKSTYKVAGSDAAAKLSVRVTLTRAGYTTTVKTSAVTKAVPKAKASVKVTGGKKSVTVRVTASGIKAPTGKVTVTYGKKKVTVKLSSKHKGKISVKLPKGTHKVKVSYAGSSQVAKASTKTLRVKVR
ncbi:Ig-like domain repeat protein [Sanguibacter massiliensis]|uniref:Ig-like domain repeat protein n=1 Tax=Sanguibacter massiliensis TaxID=1973217 RepID=UPI000C8315BF|nr:Ig-like domain repeat protein [Sanguibacter massiliensis]